MHSRKETQGNLQMRLLGGKEVEQLIGGREIVGDSVILKQHSHKTVERHQKKGDVRDEVEGWRKMNEDICRQLRRSSSEETRSYVQEEITVEEVEEWIASAVAAGLHWLRVTM